MFFIALYRGPTSATTPPAVAACQAGDDHVDNGDDAADDGVQHGSDGVDDGHEAGADGAEDAFDARDDGTHIGRVGRGPVESSFLRFRLWRNGAVA